MTRWICALTVMAIGLDSRGSQGQGPRLTKDAKESEALVGVAKIDVTPEYPVRLNGFAGRRAESDGVTQKIWVKALAIGDEPKSAAVLLTVGNLGVPDWMTRQVADRLRAKTGLDPKRLTITFTHTHTAPMLRGACPTIFGAPIPRDHQKHIDRYTEQMTGWLEEAATKALAAREKSRLSWTGGRVSFAVNRRNRGGPVDHDLPVLVIKDLSGKLRAIYTSYACHCVTFGHNKISGDWAGYAAEAIEANHPGVMAMVSIGCGADSNPRSGVTGGNIQAATEQGRMIGDEVKRLLGTAMRTVKGKVDVRYERLELPLAAIPSKAEWEERARSKNQAVAFHAKSQLARLDRGEKLKTAIDYPVQTWTFGDDLAMVFLSGEVVVDYALRLKRELDGDRVWVHGYTNDFPFYIPSERVLKEGGYEGGESRIYFDVPANFAPGVEAKIIEAVRRQVPATFNARNDAKKTGGTFPLSPERSLAAIRTRPEMVVELVAAEPLVVDPVAIDFGPDGRLWVAEMHDYPMGVDGKYKPGGRIKVLSDANGDGRYDRAATFLDNVPFPTGVMVWRGGVLVCAAPDILYAEDTNGDGRADVVKKVYSGFATHNYQARVNSLQPGLDNWVYAATGLFGGNVESFAGQKANLTSRDFRIRPETGEIEPVTGQTQQSRVRDDWDNWFGCDSGTLIRHYPVVDRYVRRNPQVAPPPVAVSVPQGAEANRLYPATSQLVTFKLSGPAGYVTAACGLGIYRDELLGSEYYGNSFTCEPVVQAVHRLELSPRGPTFSGRRPAGEERSEFLASSDNWFRPVQVRTGPDGALWVVDMYRYVIEHPIWIPPDVLATLDVRAGDRMGRIYRVYRRDRPPRPMPRLDRLNTAQLAAALDTANGTVRDMVQQMVVARGDRAAGMTVQRLARDSRRPQVRVQALATLDGLGVLSEEVVRAALRDPHPGVRRHAVRLTERWAAASPALVAELARLVDDADSQVRLQLAYTLGECRGDAAADALAELAVNDVADPYIRAAVLSSLKKENFGQFTERLLAADEPAGEIVKALASMDLVTRDSGLSMRLVGAITATKPERASAWRFTALARLLESRRRLPAAARDFDAATTRQIRSLEIAARRIAADSGRDVALRVAATGLLGLGWIDKFSDDEAILASLLGPQEPTELQLAAVGQVLRVAEGATPLLLSKWESCSPQVRQAVLDGLLGRNRGIVMLLDAIENGQIAAGEIDAARRQRLLEVRDEGLRQRATRLLAGGASTDRIKLVETYLIAGAHRDRARGKSVFARTCAACHRFDGVGVAVGPDLAPLVSKPPQTLVQAILDPNQAVDPRFQNYIALTTAGESITGLLTAETSASITLTAQEGRQHVLLRGDIEALRSTSKSFMPEGLEKDISPEQMADLLAYLASAAGPPKVFHGNRPQVIHPDGDGIAILSAENCEIRGASLVFEREFRNLGYWSAEDDYALWTLHLQTPADYDVVLDYACDEGVAGNRFVLESTAAALRGRVNGTGGWNRYLQVKVGSLKLPAGLHSVVFRPDGPIRGALLDLRALRLVPPGSFVTAQAGGRPAADLAAQILDDKKPARERSKIITDHPELAADLVRAMATGLGGVGKDNREEYRRIPWIWQVSISAGRGNDAKRIKALIAVSLPEAGQPLRDWQAVVVGGGVINGIANAGAWPRERVAEILAGDTALADRWRRALELAATMADDEKVPTGTRYDALRMLGVETWDRRGRQIARYLAKGTHDELQMGAVSALGDMVCDESTGALLDSLAGLSDGNRNLALDALLRDGTRAAALLDRIADGKVSAAVLGADRVKRLKEHKNEKLRGRAAALLR